MSNEGEDPIYIAIPVHENANGDVIKPNIDTIVESVDPRQSIGISATVGTVLKAALFLVAGFLLTHFIFCSTEHGMYRLPMQPQTNNMIHASPGERFHFHSYLRNGDIGEIVEDGNTGWHRDDMHRGHGIGHGCGGTHHGHDKYVEWVSAISSRGGSSPSSTSTSSSSSSSSSSSNSGDNNDSSYDNKSTDSSANSSISVNGSTDSNDYENGEMRMPPPPTHHSRFRGNGHHSHHYNDDGMMMPPPPPLRGGNIMMPRPPPGAEMIIPQLLRGEIHGHPHGGDTTMMMGRFPPLSFDGEDSNYYNNNYDSIEEDSGDEDFTGQETDASEDDYYADESIFYDDDAYASEEALNRNA